MAPMVGSSAMVSQGSYAVYPGAQGWTGTRLLPEEHPAGFAVGRLVKRVHLEAVVVGIGLVWLDV